MTKRPPEILLYPMLAVSLRTSKHPWLRDKNHLHQVVAQLADRGWDLLVKAYASFDINESYFQALCVMAQRDFAVGRTSRAQAQVSLGLRLAQIHRFSDDKASDDSACDEIVLQTWRQVIWTLLTLDRIFAGCQMPDATLPASAFGLSFVRPQILQSDQSPVQRGEYNLTNLFDDMQHTGSTDIASINVECIYVWHMVMEDISEATIETTNPFWRGDSHRGHIISQLLDLETS